jgi:hypothetical protein
MDLLVVQVGKGVNGVVERVALLDQRLKLEGLDEDRQQLFRRQFLRQLDHLVSQHVTDRVLLTDVMLRVDLYVVDFVCVHPVLQRKLLVPHCLQHLQTLRLLQDLRCYVQPILFCHFFLFTHSLFIIIYPKSFLSHFLLFTFSIC